MIDSLLEIGPHVTALPVVHGSGDFAWEVRRLMGQFQFDCVAVPLPESFQLLTEEMVLQLPTPSMVLARETGIQGVEWTGKPNDDADADSAANYVPIDPCQPVIAAIRTAMGEHIPRRFIDLPTAVFQPHSRWMPDAYALKMVSIPQYAAAVLPFLKAPDNEQWRQRVTYMAWQLRELSLDYRNILFVCSVLEWPWVRAAFHERELVCPAPEADLPPQAFQVSRNSFYFLLGELPFITELYERARAELDDDRTLSIDGIKQLLLTARGTYLKDYKQRARRITPSILTQCLQYIRNLTLVDRCFTPQLATIVTAAKQIAGDGYAIHVLEQAKKYRLAKKQELRTARMGIEDLYLPDEGLFESKSRLPGPPLQWSQLELQPRPSDKQRREWTHRWNPFGQCSWPPEDVQIENFRQAVFDRAREAMGVDLIKTEKFTTSIRDGIDIRDTLRHWHEGEIYVKIIPPNRGKLDTAVMLFDSPADPRDYPWRATWFAEHKNESTLGFYASSFQDNPVGPGICQATYGGVMFIFPPVPIPDIWTDRRLDFTETMEERLLAASCLHSQSRQIALLSSAPPGPGWRRLAKRFGKTWVHLPLSRFGDSTVQQLRVFHVLNGREIRSHAADFIRKP